MASIMIGKWKLEKKARNLKARNSIANNIT